MNIARNTIALPLVLAAGVALGAHTGASGEYAAPPSVGTEEALSDTREWGTDSLLDGTKECAAIVGKAWRLWSHDKEGDCRDALERYAKVEDEFRRIFREEGVPEDLTLLCIVETLCRGGLTSSAGAAGVWQLMPATARAYGLRVDERVDERLDPEKSARAAARLLRDEYGRFGSWTKAVASYNCGPSRVNRRDEPWKAVAACPGETRGYVGGLAAIGLLYRKEKPRREITTVTG